MSLNTAHAGTNGVLIYSDEKVLLFSDNVTIEFPGQTHSSLEDTKQGNIYLTTHRMIFTPNTSEDPLKSFSFPFICLIGVKIEQRLLSANFVGGNVRAQENGNFDGEAQFKLTFKSDGAVQFGRALKRCVTTVQQGAGLIGPPAYTPLTDDWTEAPDSSYTSPGRIDWLPTFAFPKRPTPGTVFMHRDSAPFPGLSSSSQTQATTPQYPRPRTNILSQPIRPAPGYFPLASCVTVPDPYHSMRTPGYYPGVPQPGLYPGVPQPGQPLYNPMDPGCSSGMNPGAWYPQSQQSGYPGLNANYSAPVGTPNEWHQQRRQNTYQYPHFETLPKPNAIPDPSPNYNVQQEYQQPPEGSNTETTGTTETAGTAGTTTVTTRSNTSNVPTSINYDPPPRYMDALKNAPNVRKNQ